MAGDPAAREHHRHPRLPRALVHQGRRRRQPGDGEWHDTPDKQWRWKGDTSSDEIVGHYFVYPIYYDLVADETREADDSAASIDRITNHILDHGYQLVDVDGQRTRWGWWGPDAIWDGPDETGPARRCTSSRTCASRCT